MAVTLLQLRVFYAMKDARTPTLIQLGMVAVRVPLLLLVPVLVEPEHVVAGLMLATSVTYVAGWVLGHWRCAAGWASLRTPRDAAAGRPVAAVSVGRRVCWAGSCSVWSTTCSATPWQGRSPRCVIGTVVIGVAAVAGLVLARVPELREPLAAVRARIGRG